MVLARLHGQALVRPEPARICQLCIRLLVKNRFCIERLFFTDALATHERTLATQGLFPIGGQILVMRKLDIVATIRQVKFLEICRIRKVSVQHVAFLVTHFAGHR